SVNNERGSAITLAKGRSAWHRFDLSRGGLTVVAITDHRSDRPPNGLDLDSAAGARSGEAKAIHRLATMMRFPSVSDIGCPRNMTFD
ncbi:MAG TPA: hypothetical protein VGG92_14095, partial [Caulobacteraceae bacterium]